MITPNFHPPFRIYLHHIVNLFLIIVIGLLALLMHLIGTIHAIKTDQIVGGYQGLSKVTISELLTWLRAGY